MINIFNTITFDYEHSLSVNSRVSSVVNVDSERLGCSNDKTFTLFNYKSGEKLKTVEFESNINDLLYMNNNTMLIVLNNKSAVLFDLNSGNKKIITTDDTIFYGCDLENGVILLTTLQNPSFLIRYDMIKDTKDIINTENIIYDNILKLNDKEFITSSSLSSNIGIWSINGYELLDHYEDFRTQVLRKADSNRFIAASNEVIVVYERIEENNSIKYLQ
jgi:hypothetical protein